MVGYRVGTNLGTVELEGVVGGERDVEAALEEQIERVLLIPARRIRTNLQF